MNSYVIVIICLDLIFRYLKTRVCCYFQLAITIQQNVINFYRFSFIVITYAILDLFKSYIKFYMSFSQQFSVVEVGIAIFRGKEVKAQRESYSYDTQILT